MINPKSVHLKFFPTPKKNRFKTIIWWNFPLSIIQCPMHHFLKWTCSANAISLDTHIRIRILHHKKSRKSMEITNIYYINMYKLYNFPYVPLENHINYQFHTFHPLFLGKTHPWPLVAGKALDGALHVVVHLQHRGDAPGIEDQVGAEDPGTQEGHLSHGRGHHGVAMGHG